MSDKSDVLSPIAPIALAETSTARAPYVYFDSVPSFGFNGGVANITLEAFAYTAEGERVTTQRVIVAHLRMGALALANLKKAIEGIELLAAGTPQSRPN